MIKFQSSDSDIQFIHKFLFFFLLQWHILSISIQKSILFICVLLGIHSPMVVHTCDSVFIHFYISKIHNKQNNHIKRFVTTKCCSTFFYSHLIEQVLTMNVVHELRHESEFTHMRTASALLIHFKRYYNKCVLGYLNSMLWARALSTGRTGRLTNLTIAWIVSLFSKMISLWKRNIFDQEWWTESDYKYQLL